MAQPAIVIPPTQGNIRVLAVSTTASSDVDLGVDEADKGQYWTFISDVDCYITFHKNEITTAPDETSTSGDARTWMLSAGSPQHFMIDRDARHFRAKGSTSGYLRYYPS